MEKKRISALLFALCGFVVHTGVLGTTGQDISPDNSLVGYDDIHYEYIPKIFREENNKGCGDSDNCNGNGQCETDTDDGTKKYCICQNGYKGRVCTIQGCLEDDEDVCTKGGATCKSDGEKTKGECQCNTGESFNYREKKCKPCDCGEHGTCTFDDSNNPKCDCEKGYSLNKDKKCAVCDCGDKAKCSLDDNDKKSCVCEKGYLVNKENKCAECDCGPEGTCVSGENGKECICNDNFKVNSKSGKCEECDCGQQGTCEFGPNGKECKCDEYYKVNNASGKCEECDCGQEGTCEFGQDGKKCTCNAHFEVNSKSGKCEECDCGEKGTSCSFDDSGNQTCECAPGHSQKDNKCEECDCGEGTSCSFDASGNQKCGCQSGYSQKDNKCEKCDCGEKAKSCSFDASGNQKCVCQPDHSQKDNKCERCTCGVGTQDCSFNPEKVCTCEENYVLKDQKCEQCNCKKNEKCIIEGDQNVCKCKDKFEKDGNECKPCDCGDKGTCSYKEGKKICNCQDDYAEDQGTCKEKCEKNSDCQNGGTCTDKKVCNCPEGTGGDKCAEIKGCTEELIKRCEKGGAECKYDKNTPAKASCQCEKENLMFLDEKCLPKWCKDVKCHPDADCKYDDSTNTGYCKCKNSEQYYDYKNNKCEKVDKCKLMFCEENEECQDGNCTKCTRGYKNENESGECKPDFCNLSPNPCFGKAKCEETSIPGVVKCICEGPSSYYDGSRCKNTSCFLLGDRKSCKDDCPSNMQKKKGSEECEAKEEKNRCSKECGLGWCIKNGDKQECSCNTTFSVYNTEKGKCVLKKTLCASRLLTDDLMKCKCTGIYKYASNGITCEKRSCADDDAQKDCKEKSAGKCEDKWKDRQIPYKCRCTGDYKEDPHNNDICTEPCSLFKIKAECGGKGKVCYLNNKAVGTCVCPPPFKNEGTCNTLGEYVHKLQNVRILKKRYLKSESVIDIISLTKDILESMKTMYIDLKDAYLYNHRLDKDIISCDIWLEFTKNASEEVRRFDKQGVSDVQCDNCIKHVVLLPPSLLLEKGSIKDVKEEEMDVCSASEALCGPYADCENNTCSCREGFQISEYGARQGKTFTIVRCEDIDECKKGTHSCSANTTCQNTIGSYNCICKPGYKKKDEKKVTYKYELNKDPCVDLCTPNPCGDNGVCSISDDKMFDCKCKTGYEGTLCDRNNVAYANAKTATTVVGAVLGVILAICLIAFFLYVRRVRKNSDSEDFSPVPTRQDNAEMTERRPIRGATNRGYQ